MSDDNKLLVDAWAKVVEVDGKPRIIAYDGRWMDEHAPQTVEDVARHLMEGAYADLKLRERVAAVPQALRDTFIPRILQVNRDYARAMRELGPELEKYDKMLGEDLSLKPEDRPPTEGLAPIDSITQFDEAHYDPAIGHTADRDLFVSTVIEPQCPGFAEFGMRFQKVQIDYGEAEEILEKEFCAQGGTSDQYHDIRQAILEGHYSKGQGPTPPSLPLEFIAEMEERDNRLRAPQHPTEIPKDSFLVQNLSPYLQ